jgi:hypothetical protein
MLLAKGLEPSSRIRMLAKQHGRDSAPTMRGEGYGYNPDTVQKPGSREEDIRSAETRRLTKAGTVYNNGVAAPAVASPPARRMAPPTLPPTSTTPPPLTSFSHATLTVSELVHLASVPTPVEAIAALACAVTMGLAPGDRNASVSSLPPVSTSWPTSQRSLIRSNDLLSRIKNFDADVAPEWRTRLIALAADAADVDQGYKELYAFNKNAAAAAAKLHSWARSVKAVNEPEVDSREPSQVEVSSRESSQCEITDNAESIDDMIMEVGMNTARLDRDSPVLPPLSLEDEAELEVNRRSPKSNSWSDPDESRGSPTESNRSTSPSGSEESYDDDDAGGSYDEGSDEAEPYSIQLHNTGKLTVRCVGLDRLLEKTTPRGERPSSNSFTSQGGDYYGGQASDEASEEQAPILMLQKWMLSSVGAPAASPPPAAAAAAKNSPKKKGMMSPPKGPPPASAKKKKVFEYKDSEDEDSAGATNEIYRPSSLLDAARGRIANPKSVHGMGIRKNF